MYNNSPINTIISTIIFLLTDLESSIREEITQLCKLQDTTHSLHVNIIHMNSINRGSNNSLANDSLHSTMMMTMMMVLMVLYFYIV